MRSYHRIGSLQEDSKRKLKLIDTTLDSNYADHLMKKCPADASKSTTVDNDPKSSSVFDNRYYINLLSHEGLFQSDSVLLKDVRRRKQVEAFANDQTVSPRVGANRF
ncbi:hypothetical protein SLEP1_g15474 [Rubroshorea leprosula]|uniref:peroxidase n=1 Tax=Rubroshorea leprosula TaxID=152421 RepID=A0AAV5IMG8_9ROSI|nr:hypothetical protein SLEP1_g15474 [Rubroshorea leprosula]